MPRNLTVRVGSISSPPAQTTITHGRQLTSSNVGPAAAGYTNLQVTTDFTAISTPGTIIENKLFDGDAPSVNADNVTFRGCEFRVTSPQWWILRGNAANLVVEDCLFRPKDTNGPETTMAQSYQQGIKLFGTARGLTVRRSEFWGFGNAIEFEPECSSQAQPIIVEDTYMHHAAAITYVGADEYHHDGILCSYAAGWVQVRRCKIHSLGNTNALAFQSTGGGWSNCVIEDNSFSGFGYTLNFGDSWGSTNFTFTDNDFSTEYDVVYHGGPPNPWDDVTSVWSGNRWKVPAGAAFGNPAWDGNFWWPADGKTSGGHATDYAP